MNPHRVAIVGTGAIARGRLVPALGHLDDRVRVVAAVDVDRDRLASFLQEHDIPAGYDSTGAMLAREQPDLVVIASPPSLHTAQSIEAMRAGAWVLCEKPIAGSLADLERLQAAEKECGVFCCSVLQWRFGPVAQHLKRLIDAGALGRPLLGVSLTTWFRDAAYYQVAWRGTWLEELGGATLSHGIHALDLLLWLLGPWEEVSGVAETVVRDIEVDDVSSAVVRFGSGAIGTVVTSVVSPREESYVRLDFERATVELRHLYDYRNRNWTLAPAPGHEALADLLADVPSDDLPLHANQMRAVFDAMDAGTRPPASVVDLWSTFECVTGMYASARRRAAVRAGSIGRADPFFSSLAGTQLVESGRTP